MTMVPLTRARAFYFWVYCESFFCWITYPWWLLDYGYYCPLLPLILSISLCVCIVFVYSYIVFVSLLVFRCYMLFVGCGLWYVMFLFAPLSFVNTGILKLF